MTLKILTTRPATDDEWDTIWENCEYSTYFHSREWSEIWKKYTHGKIKPAGRIVKFSDEKTDLLPFSSRNLFMSILKQAVSSPAGTFGGWLSLHELTHQHGALLYEYIHANYKDLIWRLNPFDPIAGHIELEHARSDETLALNLERGFEAIYKNWTQSHASAARKARKARKEGVEIKEASSLQDWKDYFEVYKGSLDRWGESVSSVYQWSLFQDFHDLHSSRVKLWLAVYHDRIVSGALCFYAKIHVVYWHGAALSEYFHLRPVNLLIYEIVKDACEHDYQWFDFNPSGGHNGVENFKKSFGTSSLKCPIVQKRSKTVQLAKILIGITG